LSALSKYMCSSQIRLESCLGNVTRVGWNQAYGEVAGSSLSSVRSKKGEWENNKWVGHTLRFLTGSLRGEKYPIISNSKNTLMLAEKNSKYIPRSSPNRKTLKPNTGNKFSIGPGYSTPMCYTRKSGESAVWTWKNVIPYPGIYNLYIHGLNDAIDTTEFLEENNNASLDVELWNYKTKEFDMLKKRGKYGKQDSFNAGKVKPENISDDGSVKIQLTAHNVIERNTDDITGKILVGSGGKQTGIAWFNYAVVTSVPVPGRVNINTASERLLSSLPGIDKKLAKNIVEGIDRNGKKDLKPYENLGGLFKVKGMTPDIFERCVNILCLDSSAFTVDVEAQILKPILMEERRPRRPNSENIIATRKKRFVIEVDSKTDGYIDINEKERYPVR
ncbi:helix-hairpin-helix domain-containing protein, partial [bacterium]|nr:helix-hairpin-helix domain-containing protein [bacterium]